MRCKIADLQVDLISCHPQTEETAKAYACEAIGTPDIVINSAEYHLLGVKAPENFSVSEKDYGLSGVCFSRKILDFQGVVLHASAVLYEGKAYLFTAPSGIGKSTHTALWCKSFSACEILNDDKPVLRIVDGKIYVYGTPWAGKNRINKNTCAPLGGICLLHRGQSNVVKPVPFEEAWRSLYRQVPHSHLTETQMDQTLWVLEQVVKQAPIYRLECTKSLHAVEVAREALLGNSR